MGYKKNLACLLDFLKEALEALETPNQPTAALLMIALGSIADSPTVGQLAERAEVGVKNCSRILKSLRGQGWIRYAPSDHDERERRVELTPAGAAVLRAVNALIVKCAEGIITNIGNARKS